ncbi:hypothetical protein DY218_21670 [Streptomyces triticagri]|uniref:Uncharacterized protein n=1 Tax=Streptomyces triticagri TaxID=2293568 RepID=A0A372M160_9ACTN|nr:hypothetical protein [Streptomyces triticagri]RFU84559.1 hypothetical protein DY218_21670 [Streptomyces triticagri]
MAADRRTGADDNEVGPVPHDPPDQQAGTEQNGEDPWEVDIPEPDGRGSDAPQEDDVPETDEAGTARRGSRPATEAPPANPEPDESPG